MNEREADAPEVKFLFFSAICFPMFSCVRFKIESQRIRFELEGV